MMRTKMIAALAFLLLACSVRADTYTLQGNCIQDAAPNSPIVGLVVELTFILPDGHGGYTTRHVWTFTDNNGDFSVDFNIAGYDGSDTTAMADVVPGQPWKGKTVNIQDDKGPGIIPLGTIRCTPDPTGKWIPQ